jgi:hypothetical protein
MGSILFYTNNPKDLSILQQFAHKMGLQSEVLTDGEKADIAFAQAIEENDRDDRFTLLEDALNYYENLKRFK